MYKIRKIIFTIMALLSFPVIYSHPLQDSVDSKKPIYKWKERHYKSHHLSNGILNIETDHGLVQAIPYTPDIIEIKNFTGNIPENDSSVAVVLQPKNPVITVEVNNKYIFLKTNSITIAFHKSPFYATFIYRGDTLLVENNGYFERSNNNGLKFKIGKEENFYGLGERAVNFSLKGKRYILYNQPNYGYGVGADYLNYSVPLVVSSKRYLLFLDNPQKGYVDIGQESKEIMEWGNIGGIMKYFFVGGNDFKEIFSNWGKLTGTQPLPPFWALGNLQSRMAYSSQKETDSIVNLMQKNGFPIDAVIIDLLWFGGDVMGYMGKLDWYKPNWPAPQKMMNNFKNKGVKTVIITEPYIIDTLKNYKLGVKAGIFTFDSTGNTYINKDFFFGPAGLIDIFNPKAQNWFWGKYKKLTDEGVSGWWGDLGEPEYHPADELHINGSAEQVHNIYAHIWHKTIYDGYRKDFPSERIFNLNRSGYAGSQRYSVFPWTGDVARSWSGLQAQLPALLHMSMSGLPFVHSDAGGFAGGEKDEELYTRWMQFACFTPILRPHGQSDIAKPEPVFYSQQTQNIVKKYIKLRYSLLPYIYTLAAQASIKGYPIMRPLFFDFPDDWQTYYINNEYMFGDNILVAPVIEKDATSVSVYLPKEKKWYNFNTNRKMPGGIEYDIPVNINDIPIFIKAGSFIPMIKPINNTKNYSTKSLIINYYVNNSNDRDVFLMYEDNLTEPDAIENKNFETLMFVQKQNEKGNLTFMFTKLNSYDDMPVSRNVKLNIIGLKYEKEQKFNLNNQPLKKKKIEESGNGYYWDELKNYWVIDFKWSIEDIYITGLK
jgi:alpha-glucosidase (family GH31 glycosyl hydrolase)